MDLSLAEQREQNTPGVALYALWEATEADWQLWRDAMTGGGQ